MTSDVIRGAIKINGFIDDKCFTSWQAFVESLPNLLTVEIPSDATNVSISSQQPSNDQRNSIWIRQDNSGAFIGIYVFTRNGWQQIAPAPNQIIRMYGDSRSIPNGYALIDNTNPNFTAPEVAAIRSTWIKDPTNTFYRVFEVTFVGV